MFTDNFIKKCASLIFVCFISGGIQADPPNFGVVVVNDESNPVPVKLVEDSPVPVEVVRGSYVYIGPSTQTTTGAGGGHRGMNALCHATYDTARMCTTSELSRSIVPSPPTAGYPDGFPVWVEPDISQAVYDSRTSRFHYLLASGELLREVPEAHGGVNCSNWFTTDNDGVGAAAFLFVRDGTVLTPVGAWTCGSVMHVACCAP